MDGGSFAYPGHPGAAGRTKGKIPGGLEGLEKLIRLEEGGDPKGVDESDDEDAA